MLYLAESIANQRVLLYRLIKSRQDADVTVRNTLRITVPTYILRALLLFLAKPDLFATILITAAEMSREMKATRSFSLLKSNHFSRPRISK